MTDNHPVVDYPFVVDDDEIVDAEIIDDRLRYRLGRRIERLGRRLQGIR